MINGVTPFGYTAGGTLATSPSNAKLSSEKADGLNKVLSNFEKDNLSADDAKAIAGEVEKLGIKKGPALGNALRDAGFDPREIAEKADQVPPGFNSSPKSNGINAEALARFTTIIESYGTEKLSEEDADKLFAELKDNGFDTLKPIIDITA